MARFQHSIFRERAMVHYLQRRQKDVLPRLIAPHTFVFLWILLGALLIAVVFLLPALFGFSGGW